ncbi:AmmeMemoRadiSam system protein B [Phytomonospora sp. NPDC050363]|uniref:AmmeMemoRadiSam system protein B n=1 Tax=Phytomonospora sp. NPDC050363 TaxID=3155642 RepID=UPI0033C71109
MMRPEARPTAVAGRFYPGDPSHLRTMIRRMLNKIEVPADEQLAPAYVVPHAGYRFSGPVAATVYARLERFAGKVDRVVILGPSHFARLEGCAGSPAGMWETPLGDLHTVDAPGLPADPVPHQREHSIEVQLPFIQTVLGDVRITPIAVGYTPAEEVADLIDATVADDPRTVVLCSTDFSHFHPDEVARDLDRRTAAAVCELDHERIDSGDACGVFALRGLVAWAARHKYLPRQLALRTSADSYGGNPNRVVGYPAFAVDA